MVMELNTSKMTDESDDILDDPDSTRRDEINTNNYLDYEKSITKKVYPGGENNVRYLINI